MVRKTNRNRQEIQEKIEELQDRKEDQRGEEYENTDGKIEALRWVLAHRHEL